MRNYKDKINKVGDNIEGIDTINAGEFNSIANELKNVLNSASITTGDLNESGEDILNNQLAQAIYKLIQISNNWQDISIESNNLILNKSDNVVLTPTPIVGSKIQWINQYANTGIVSIKVGTYPITNLKTLNNNDLAIDDLKLNSFYSAVFDGVNWRVEQISSQSFTGMIYCGTEQPNSLLCNGNAISRVQYARLFSKIGIIYGSGDGLSTFNLPDLINRVPRGSGSLINEGVKQEDSIKDHDLRIDNITGLNTRNAGEHSHGTDIPITSSSGGAQTGIYKAGAYQGIGSYASKPAGDHNHSIPDHKHTGKGGDFGITETRVKSLGVKYWIYY